MVILVLNFLVFRHFLVDVMVAASIAAMLGPVYDRLNRGVGGRRSLAAGLLVALTTVVILVPLTAYGLILANQAVNLFTTIRPKLEPEALRSVWNEALPARFPWIEHAREWLQVDEPDPVFNVMEFVGPALSRIASGANRLVQGTVAGLTSAFFDLILFLLTLFFILRDGLKLRDELQSIAPVTPQRAKEVYVQLAKTVKGVLYSMVVVPVSQGILAMIGFALFGLPSPLFWGTMLIFGAMIPGIGSPPRLDTLCNLHFICELLLARLGYVPLWNLHHQRVGQYHQAHLATGNGADSSTTGLFCHFRGGPYFWSGRLSHWARHPLPDALRRPNLPSRRPSRKRRIDRVRCGLSLELLEIKAAWVRSSRVIP